MFVYGSKASFEWGFKDGDNPVVTAMLPAKEGERGNRTASQVVSMPNPYRSLPEELWKYTVDSKSFDPLNPQKSLEKGAGGGHHGSHPHLVHEFVKSIIERRRPYIDEVLGGNITAAGICAHESAMKNGEAVEVPVF